MDIYIYDNEDNSRIYVRARNEEGKLEQHEFLYKKDTHEYIDLTERRKGKKLKINR